MRLVPHMALRALAACVVWTLVACQQQPLPDAAAAKQPNIVFVITDDQDLHLASLDYQPLLRKHLIEQGTFYARHYCTIAICCPSRVSLLTGKAAHNTNVTSVAPPYGGYPKFLSQGFNEDYLPLWLQDAGYNTYYTGKLFNAHSVDNYDIFPKGFNGSDFLLDPFTYQYLNPTFQRNKDQPVNHKGEYSTDLITRKALGFLDEAVQATKPFFLGVAPIAPHANVERPTQDVVAELAFPAVNFSEPIPAARHAHLFNDVRVPRSKSFNPDETLFVTCLLLPFARQWPATNIHPPKRRVLLYSQATSYALADECMQPSGGSWVRHLPRQSKKNVDYNDHFYRQRIRSLQAVDELVDDLVTRLDELNILDNTYIVYTSDNGFHIGQHRLQPGKTCGYEEDVNIPLIIRGPGVPRNFTTEIVTTHTDLAPTFFEVAGFPPKPDFDGAAIPLNRLGLVEGAHDRHEHVNIEYWGFSLAEGDFDFPAGMFGVNNTYKALRVVGKGYNIYYSVWCDNEHELYDMDTDPHQMKNLMFSTLDNEPQYLLDQPVLKVAARLDSLLLVLKSCKGTQCVRPWESLHPKGNVQNLLHALSPRFDAFYEREQLKVRFARCEPGYIIDAEGPQFEDGLIYRGGLAWHEWV